MSNLGVPACYTDMFLSSYSEPQCGLGCASGFSSSGSSQIADCPDAGGPVNVLWSCTEITCTAFTFAVGMQGSDGTNACPDGIELSAVTRPTCDLKFYSGYASIGTTAVSYTNPSPATHPLLFNSAAPLICTI